MAYFKGQLMAMTPDHSIYTTDLFHGAHMAFTPLTHFIGQLVTFTPLTYFMEPLTALTPLTYFMGKLTGLTPLTYFMGQLMALTPLACFMGTLMALSPLTYFMGQLMAEDSHSGAETTSDAGGKGGADGQPVTQIVNSVPEDHHPGHGRHRIWDISMVMGVTVTMTLRLDFTLIMPVGMIVAWMHIFVQKGFVVVSIVGDDCRFSDRNVVITVRAVC